MSFHSNNGNVYNNNIALNNKGKIELLDK